MLNQRFSIVVGPVPTGHAHLYPRGRWEPALLSGEKSALQRRNCSVVIWFVHDLRNLFGVRDFTIGINDDDRASQ